MTERQHRSDSDTTPTGEISPPQVEIFGVAGYLPQGDVLSHEAPQVTVSPQASTKKAGETQKLEQSTAMQAPEAPPVSRTQLAVPRSPYAEGLMTNQTIPSCSEITVADNAALNALLPLYQAQGIFPKGEWKRLSYQMRRRWLIANQYEAHLLAEGIAKAQEAPVPVVDYVRADAQADTYPMFDWGMPPKRTYSWGLIGRILSWFKRLR